MQEYHADPSAVHVLRILCALAAALLNTAAGLLMSPWPILMWGSIAISVGICAFLFAVALPVRLRRLRCIVTANQLSVRSGMLMHREQTILLRRIQLVRRLSVGRLPGLQILVVQVYGGRLVVPFLRRQDCRELAALLRRRSGRRVS